jgi:hypothetical protein
LTASLRAIALVLVSFQGFAFSAAYNSYAFLGQAVFKFIAFDATNKPVNDVWRCSGFFVRLYSMMITIN